MPTASFSKFDQFIEDVGNGVHDLDADDLQVYLSNAAPSQTLDAVKADLAEITPANGYTGPVSVNATYSQTSGTGNCVAVTDPVTITASGGAINTFRYVVLMNTTPTSPLDPLIGYWDYGSAVDLGDGDKIDIDFGATLFTLGP